MKEKIVLIGKPLFDFYGHDYEFLPPESELDAYTVERYLEKLKNKSEFSEPGGCTLNIAKHLVKPKKEVYLIGSIGNDEIGEEYKKHAEEKGIKLYLKHAEETTGITVNSMKGKCWYYYGASNFLDETIEEYWNDIIESDMIIVDAYSFTSPHNLLLEIFEKHPGEKYLILSGCKKDEFIKKYISPFNFLKNKKIKFEIIFGNHEEWRSLSEDLIPESNIKVITYPWGCEIIEKHGKKKIQIVHETISVENIYTISAGDVFSGTFISLYVEKYPIEECAREACKNSFNKIKSNIRKFWRKKYLK